jgi:hypothetical protein
MGVNPNSAETEGQPSPFESVRLVNPSLGDLMECLALYRDVSVVVGNGPIQDLFTTFGTRNFARLSDEHTETFRLYVQPLSVGTSSFGYSRLRREWDHGRDRSHWDWMRESGGLGCVENGRATVDSSPAARRAHGRIAEIPQWELMEALCGEQDILARRYAAYLGAVLNVDQDRISLEFGEVRPGAWDVPEVVVDGTRQNRGFRFHEFLSHTQDAYSFGKDSKFRPDSFLVLRDAPSLLLATDAIRLWMQLQETDERRAIQLASLGGSPAISESLRGSDHLPQGVFDDTMRTRELRLKLPSCASPAEVLNTALGLTAGLIERLCSSTRRAIRGG